MNKMKVISAVVLSISVSVATAHPGVGIVMDSKGNVFYTDLRHIWKIDNKGTRTIAVQNVHSHEIYLGDVKIMAENLRERKFTQFTVNDAHLAMGLWTDKKENVYVAIYGARKVKKITPDKKISVVVETSLLWSPTGGLVAPNGDFWLLEYSQTNQARVERITVDGERIVYSVAE